MSGTALPQLGKYTIVATLGKGAMGTVYDGMDPVIQRRVAIKTVRIPSAQDEEAQEGLARFKREAQAAGRLNHPNIVGVFDYGETDDLAYIVMEFIDGRSLKEMLDDGSRLPLFETLRLMEDLLAGLTYSHERGVVHRDIKPANIMITREGRAKIADFGIARIESSSLTQAGTVLGTPAYMSPEQFMGQTVDRRTDIYSSGVLLYQLLTGERPFEGGLTAIMHKTLNTVPLAPSELSVTAPPGLDPVVARAMARRPEDRFPDAYAFAQALRATTAAAPADVDATMVTASARPASAITKPPPAPTEAAKPNRLPLIAGGGVGLLALAGVAGWLLLSPGPRPAAPVEVAAAGRHAVQPPNGGPPAVAAPVVTAGGANRPPIDARTTAPTGQIAVATADIRPTTTPQPSPAQVPLSQVAPAQVAPTQVTPAQVAPELRTTAAPRDPPVQGPTQTTPPHVITNPVNPPPLVMTDPRPVATTPPPPPVVADVPRPPPVQSVQPLPANLGPPSAAPVTPPPVVASIERPPAALHSALAAALPGIACSLAFTTLSDSGAVRASGIAGAGRPADALRQAAAGADPRIDTFDGPFCRVLDTLRPFAQRDGTARLPVRLPEGDALHDNQLLVLGVSMPEFAGHLQVEYFQHDSTVAHQLPSAAYPDRTYAVGERAEFGRKRGNFEGWPVGPPFGTDMIVVIASTAPLFAHARADGEPMDTYLRDLQAAITELRRHGGSLAANAVLVRISP